MTEGFDRSNAANEVDRDPQETLRLLARLAPPEGMNDRVQARLRMATTGAESGFWTLWRPVRRLQFAGAALLALAVAGASWSLHQAHSSGPGAVANPAAVQGPASGGFGTAGTARVPPTLRPIVVPPAPKKKPGAGHAKRAAKPNAGLPADANRAPNP